MSPENKEHYQSEKESIHLLLTGIRDEIYSTVNDCKTTHDMWIANERLQQGESLNIQDYQKEVNEIHAERIAKNANPLAFVAATQQYPDPYYQAPKSHKSYAPPSKQSSSTRSNASTKFKGIEIAKPITPSSESNYEKDNDPEQAQRDKDINKNIDNSPRYKNDNQTGQFTNQRTVTVARARETVNSQVVQQTGIQCFNCKEFGHFAKECRKPKKVKDYTYHKENMLLYKQDKKGVPLQAKQADWLEDKDDEINEQELEAHYNYMAKIQETNQNAEDELDVLANLIANLTLDTEENIKILKQLKKPKASLTQELKE
nr:hypothetical protein [Tanacetum cinerariifolium]